MKFGTVQVCVGQEDQEIAVDKLLENSLSAMYDDLSPAEQQSVRDPVGIVCAMFGALNKDYFGDAASFATPLAIDAHQKGWTAPWSCKLTQDALAGDGETYMASVTMWSFDLVNPANSQVAVLRDALLLPTRLDDVEQKPFTFIYPIWSLSKAGDILAHCKVRMSRGKGIGVCTQSLVVVCNYTSLGALVIATFRSFKTFGLKHQDAWLRVWSSAVACVLADGKVERSLCKQVLMQNNVYDIATLGRYATLGCVEVAKIVVRAMAALQSNRFQEGTYARGSCKDTRWCEQCGRQTVIIHASPSRIVGSYIWDYRHSWGIRHVQHNC